MTNMRAHVLAGSVILFSLLAAFPLVTGNDYGEPAKAIITLGGILANLTLAAVMYRWLRHPQQ